MEITTKFIELKKGKVKINGIKEKETCLNFLEKTALKIFLFGKELYEEKFVSFDQIYKATQNGFSSSNFHKNCDGKTKLIVIIKSNKYVFGGYNDIGWNSVSKFVETKNSFIFSLSNPQGKPVLLDPVKFQYSIYDDASSGPCFGGGYDICIRDKPNKSTKNFTNIGHTYKGKTKILFTFFFKFFLRIRI